MPERPAPQPSQQDQAKDALRSRGVAIEKETNLASLIGPAVQSYLGVDNPYPQDNAEMLTAVAERNLRLALVLIANGAQLDTTVISEAKTVLENPQVPTRELTVGPLTGYHLKLSGLSSEAVEQLGDSITSLIGQEGLSLEFGRQADTLQGEESPASGGLSVSSRIVRLDEVTSQTNPLTNPSGAGMLQIKTTDPVGNYTTTSRFFPDPIRFSLFPHMTLTIKPSLLTGKQAFDRGVIGVATGHPKS